MNLRDLTDPQPSPTSRPDGLSMHDVASSLHQIRREHGEAKYGTLLHAVNGREPGIDEVQELLDATVYRIQAAVETRAVLAQLIVLRSDLFAMFGGRGTDVFDRAMNSDVLVERCDQMTRALLADAAARSDVHLPRP